MSPTLDLTGNGWGPVLVASGVAILVALAAGACSRGGNATVPTDRGFSGTAGSMTGDPLGGGGAAGVDETGGAVRSSYDTYEADDAYYNRIHERVNAGGRAVAVDDNVPSDVLTEAVTKHGGEILNSRT